MSIILSLEFVHYHKITSKDIFVFTTLHLLHQRKNSFTTMTTNNIVPIHTQVVTTVILLALFFTVLPAINSSSATSTILTKNGNLNIADDSTQQSRRLPVEKFIRGAEENRQLVRGNDQVRLAVFGSSNAWGAALDNRFDAYPFLLSPEVVNYADFAAGPNYASVCVNSMVGSMDDDFDVIILDYWLKSHEGLQQLAVRLRRRYPHAVMIFTRLWSPNTARRQQPDDATEMSLYEWKKTIPGLENAPYEDTKAAILADADGYWYFPDYQRQDDTHEAAVAAVGGMHFQFPMRPTAKQTIVDYMGYFDEATHSHVSTRGHAAIAAVMKDIIQTQMGIVRRGGDVTVTSAANAVFDGHDGTWGRGDSCHLWFTTGGCRFAHSDNWGMIKYDEKRGKFALHVEDTGWIDVVNDFADSRTLYLSFLATTANTYPKTLAEFAGAGGDPVSIELEPVTDLDRHHAHLTRTIPVGMLAPGTTRITLTQLEMTATLPFRLLGASFTNEEAVPLEFSFGPAFNS